MFFSVFCLFLAPVFDYEDIPSPLSESESTITVLLRPALARGAPVRYNYCLVHSYTRLHSALIHTVIFIAATKKSSLEQTLLRACCKADTILRTTYEEPEKF